MSSGLMASAQMRMKQKREKASQAAKVSSPSSIASPSSAGVASPLNNNGNSSGNKKHNMMNPASASPSAQGGFQTDFMPPEHQYASPQQQQQQSSPHYNDARNNNTRYQQNYHQPQSAAASPLAASPNRPMQNEEQFDTAIQHRGNYTHHLSARNTPSPNRPRRGYDSYTDAPKEEQERFNQQYYKSRQHHAPPPPPPPPPAMPPQRQQGGAAFNSFAPSPHNAPNDASGNNNNMSPYFQDSQDENMMDGGEYDYDITEDEEAYVNERSDMVAPIMAPRTPVFSQPVDDEENETISSEVALNGNPTKKKKEKKSKKVSKDARFLIHNVGSDDAMDKPASVSDPRYGIHLSGSNDDGDDDDDSGEVEDGRASPDRQYNYGDIAAHAGRYAAGSQPGSFAPKPIKATTKNPFDDDDVGSFGSNGRNLPKRIGNANSWDGSERNNSMGNGNESNVPVWDGGNKQRNMWEDDNSATMQKFDRNSKSWDQENKTSFEQNLWAGSFFGESGSQLKQNDGGQPPNQQTLAAWDKAEAEWQDKVSPARAQEPPKDEELDSVLDKNYPWKAQQHDTSSAPTGYTGKTEVNMPVSDSEESDGDSLFEFEKKKQNYTPNDNTSADPNEAFTKISQGLQQADDARNVAQNLQGGESDEAFQNELKFRSHQGPTSPSRSVAFVGEEGNKVHTYHVQQDHDHSGSDSGTYETRDDDDDDDETDGETLEDGDTIDNYTLDDATYGESTIGGTTIDTSRKPEDDINIMDHVDHAVKAIGSALGGILLLANNAASSLSAETAENDDTMQGTSTIGQESEETNAKAAGTSEYDWIGYMEKFLFPETDQETAGGETDTQTNMSTLRSNSNTASGTASTEEEENNDDYLLQQALASARAIHHIHGIQFDELQDINVLTDIKFVVVTVALPLGLLFQEHELGAWVSRVVPDGNGARKEIQPGDQLAAINGKSSAHATIDEVASIISGTPKNEGVELTFLRYVGPLRPVPGAVIQEGFEVTDKNVSGKEKKAKKRIFGLKKANQTAGNKASLDFSPNRRRAKNLNISMTQEQSKPNSNQSTDVKSPQSDKGKSSFKKMFRGKKKS
uniref:PDZ domain-containing protein n=1 Tax=Skeletonema marinoi TaxID=267567 RepID=A0A7S2LJP8_9STRA|mmetsp:Transcript_26148/g.44467  ORF Transcript_26148/g.44467 Transcript_26148/m.44467 type:complete len:1083 (+) Transcript_26148:77-3325(+)